jgi:hypothetical protein
VAAEADGLGRAVVEAGQHHDRRENAGVPVADQFPGARDSHQQQHDQGVAEPRGAEDGGAFRGQADPAGDLAAERRQQEHDQPGLPPRLLG